MADVVISEFMAEQAITQILGAQDVHYDPQLVDDREALLREVRDARALIVRNRTQVDEALLAGAPQLRVVGRLGVGLDNIDLDACKAREVVVHPATGANDVAVAEYVITAALILLRGAWMASAQVLAGEWPRTALVGGEAYGRCLGLVGFGAIARETASRARALGFNIIAHDPYLAPDDPAWQQAERVDLSALLARAQVLSLHVPATPQTRGMIDAQAIGKLRGDAIVINAARGGIVDEQALAEALREGRIGGVALDVFAAEPLTAQAGERWRGLPNVLLTPHIAGVTVESNLRVSRVTAQNVLRYL